MSKHNKSKRIQAHFKHRHYTKSSTLTVSVAVQSITLAQPFTRYFGHGWRPDLARKAIASGKNKGLGVPRDVGGSVAFIGDVAAQSQLVHLNDE